MPPVLRETLVKNLVTTGAVKTQPFVSHLLQLSTSNTPPTSSLTVPLDPQSPVADTLRAAQFVAKTIREKLGDAAADLLKLNHYQGAYIALSTWRRSL